MAKPAASLPSARQGGMATSGQAKFDPTRWSTVGSNLPAKPTLPTGRLPNLGRRDVRVNSQIDANQFLGRFTLLVPEVATSKGLGSSPLEGIAPAQNPLGQLNRSTDRDTSLGDVLPTGPEFDRDSLVPGLIDARVRGEAFQDAVRAGGISPAMQATLFGTARSTTPEIGYNPNATGSGIEDLADLPGLSEGQDLSSFDKGGDPRVSNETDADSGNQPTTSLGSSAADAAQGAATGRRETKVDKENGTKTTTTYDAAYNVTSVVTEYDTSRYYFPHEKIRQKVNFKLPQDKVTGTVETYQGGKTWGTASIGTSGQGSRQIPVHTTVTDSSPRAVVVRDANGNATHVQVYVKRGYDRPVDDDLSDKTVTAETLRRWEAKMDGLVNPTDPDSMVDHDVAKLAQKTIAGIQSTINPPPDGDDGSQDSGSDDRRKKLPPGVGPGVVTSEARRLYVSPPKSCSNQASRALSSASLYNQIKLSIASTSASTGTGSSPFAASSCWPARARWARSR